MKKPKTWKVKIAGETINMAYDGTFYTGIWLYDKPGFKKEAERFHREEFINLSKDFCKYLKQLPKKKK